MRKCIMLIAACTLLSASAQDVITKRDGEEILAKVTEITDNEVKYKKWSNQEGPSYTTKKVEIFMIKYKNGEKDVFTDTPSQQTPPSTQSTSIALDNQTLIDNFNNYHVEYIGNDTNKKGEAIIGLLGIAPTSVLCNDDIELSFTSILATPQEMKTINTYCALNIKVKNKRDTPIYIDQTKCFFIQEAGSEPFKEDKVTIHNNSTTHGIGVGIGPLAIGKSTQNSQTIMRNNENITVVPPMGSTVLFAGYFNSTCYIGKDGSRVHTVATPYPFTAEGILCATAFNLGESPNRGLYSSYNPQSSPMNYSVLLNYSAGENYTESQNMTVHFYLKDAFVCDASFGYAVKTNVLQGLGTAKIGWVGSVLKDKKLIKKTTPMPQ